MRIKYILIFILSLLFVPGSSFGATEEKLSIFRMENNLSGTAAVIIKDNPKFKWRKQLASYISAVPVLADDKILLSCSDKKVYCLKADDFTELWNYPLSAESEAPVTVYGDKVIISTTDNKIVVLGLKDGKQLWDKVLGGKVAGAANVFLAGDKLRILVGSYDNNFYCLDLAGGEILWQIKADNYINSSVSIEGDLAAVGSCDGFMYFANIAKGDLAGKFDTGAYIPGWPVMLDKTCFCGNYNGDFFAISTVDYQQKWKYSVEGATFMSGPAVTAEKVLFADQDGNLFCLDKSSGEESWRFKADDKTLTAPLVVGDAVFCGSENGNLYMLNLSDGKIKWKYLVGEPLTLGVFWYKGALYFPDDSGRLYCFSVPFDQKTSVTADDSAAHK